MVLPTHRHPVQVDGDDTPDSTPKRRKKKKKAIGDLHEGADSLQIGFGATSENSDDEEYEYEPPPPPEHDTNEVERVINPHPALWNPYEHFKLDISEVSHLSALHPALNCYTCVYHIECLRHSRCRAVASPTWAAHEVCVSRNGFGAPGTTITGTVQIPQSRK